MYRNRGFTLIELMIAVAVVGILAAVAIPSYSQYVFRSRIPEGLQALSAFGVRMEQRYQDAGNYGTGTACALGTQVVGRFTVTCQLLDAGQGFLATATGDASVRGVSFSLNHNGVRQTVSHPNGVPPTACWSTRGGQCDS